MSNTSNRFMKVKTDFLNHPDYKIKRRFSRVEAHIDLALIRDWETNQIPYSERELAKRWHWSQPSVHRFLHQLSCIEIIDSPPNSNTYSTVNQTCSKSESKVNQSVNQDSAINSRELQAELNQSMNQKRISEPQKVNQDPNLTVCINRSNIDIDMCVQNFEKKKRGRKKLADTPPEDRVQLDDHQYVWFTKQAWARLCEKHGEQRVRAAALGVDLWCRANKKHFKDFEAVLLDWGFDKLDQKQSKLINKQEPTTGIIYAKREQAEKTDPRKLQEKQKQEAAEREFQALKKLWEQLPEAERQQIRNQVRDENRLIQGASDKSIEALCIAKLKTLPEPINLEKSMIV